MGKNFKCAQILKKWYNKLAFPHKYDEEFEELIAEYEFLPDTDIYNYKFDTWPENAGFNLLMCLYFCEKLEAEYTERGISYNVLYDTLSDIVIWTDTYYGLKGVLGISEVNWLKNHLSLKLFRIGRLQFCIDKAYEDIPKLNVKSGENIIAIHIPGGKALDTAECIDSIELARQFYQKYFPDYDYKCFTCSSWLLDDTLSQFMNENSNIIKFQKLFNYVTRKESYM